jgi:hypothetical protein
MQINLSFNTLAELQEFAAWAHSRGELGAVTIARDIRGADTRPVTAEGAVIPTGEPQDAQEPASAGAGEPPSPDPAPEPAPKRKRRTKAEIAADEAAAEAGNEPGATDATGDEPDAPAPQEDGPTDEPPITDTPAELVALAGTIDGADKLAHMNEGRDFISKHGFPKYNETFALADVPANIAAHTPEQAALHRAAMQWLAAQGGAK